MRTTSTEPFCTLLLPCLRTRKDTSLPLRDPSNVDPDNLLNMLVSDVLAASPAAAGVFTERRMRCAGCAFAPFETVAEVADVYGIDRWELASSLAAMASTSEVVRQ